MLCCLPQPIADDATPANDKTRPTARTTAHRLRCRMQPLSCAMPRALPPGASGPPAQRGEPLFRLSEGLQGIEQAFDDPHQRAEAGCLARIVEEVRRSVERDREPVLTCRPLVLELRAPPSG